MSELLQLEPSRKRRRLDFYETPVWQTESLKRRVQVFGRVLEPCVGDHAIALQFGLCEVITNDINPERRAHFHSDATIAETWAQFGEVDWVVTNPPFNCALPIVQNALKVARVGVVMLLRISFLEPTEARNEFLSLNPPSRLIVLPRWSYTGKGTDSVTTAWFVWMRSPSGCGVDVVPREEKHD